jgi:hypothetical protein
MDEIDVLINDIWYMIFWCVISCNWFSNNFDMFYSTIQNFEKLVNVLLYKCFI